ncbi:MAG: OsmC family protein [Chloroflexaceae bacterium]|jgi:putative redox protein|nr:OsmC family protein [Chloroflexaceae bacterium]
MATASARVRLREGMHFVATSGSEHQVDMDSPSEGGKAGASPMEMVLMSLAGCSGMDVIAILRKKRQPVTGLDVTAYGERAEGYPQVYTKIQLEYIVTGNGVDPAAVQRAIDLSRETYCPVWAMLAHSVTIEASFRIES